MSDLKKRTITAFFIGLITLGAVLGGEYTFALLILLIAFGINTEIFMMYANRRSDFKGYVFAAITTFPLLIAFVSHFGFLQLTLFHLILAMPLFVTIAYFLFLGSKPPFQFRLLLSAGFSLVYITLGLATMIRIGWPGGEYDYTFLLGMILLIWINDSFAYFTGRLFGRRPLALQISPKKTWEGTIGGVLFTLLGAFLLHVAFNRYSLPFWLGFGFLVALFANIGDLLQSSMKRAVRIKDSGNILPGHGGVFDRYDSFVCIAPVIFAYLAIILN